MQRILQVQTTIHEDILPTQTQGCRGRRRCHLPPHPVIPNAVLPPSLSQEHSNRSPASQQSQEKTPKLGPGVVFHGWGPLWGHHGVCLRWEPAAGAAAAAAGLEPQPPKGTRGLQEHVMPFIRAAGKKINHTSPPLSFCTFPLGHFFQLHHLV